MLRFSLASALILAGCTAGPHTATRPLTGAPIELDRPLYVALRQTGASHPYAFDVVARFTNATADTIFLATGSPGGPRPSYWVAGGASSRSAYNPTSSGVGHDRQIAVAPGAVRVDTLRLAGPSVEYEGMPVEALEGPMRLVYLPQGCRGDGACRLPYEVATSDTFEVRLE